MFDSKHYVPILKWKRAEKSALGALEEADRASMTPLIQFVMPKPKIPEKGKKDKTPDEKLSEVISSFTEKVPKLVEEIEDKWGISPIFVDASLLYSTQLKVETLTEIIEGANKRQMHLVPVVNLGDDLKIKEAVFSLAKKHNTGLCLRLIPHDLVDVDKLNERIRSFVVASMTSEKNIDLLIDTKEKVGSEEYARHVVASQKIHNLSAWRTFIFAAGAFPADLSLCKMDEENLIPRLDWKNWLQQIKDKDVLRKPAFSDYTIQHPIYNELSQFFHPTTSIKYALDNDWLIMKGKKQRFEMYLANAKLLSEDPRYYREGHCKGDKFISEKALHYPAYSKNPAIKGTGGTESWLTMGINHHLVLAVHQVANLV